MIEFLQTGYFNPATIYTVYIAGSQLFFSVNNSIIILSVDGNGALYRGGYGPVFSLSIYFFKEVVLVFLDSDFNEIRQLLLRACDQCLLTRSHCSSCNVERLLGSMESIEFGSRKPGYMVTVEELDVLTDPSSPAYAEVAEKWRNMVKRN